MGETIYIIAIVGLGIWLASYKGRSRLAWSLISLVTAGLGLIVLACLPNRRKWRLVLAGQAQATAQAASQAQAEAGARAATQSSNQSSIVINMPAYPPMPYPYPPQAVPGPIQAGVLPPVVDNTGLPGAEPRAERQELPRGIND